MKAKTKIISHNSLFIISISLINLFTITLSAYITIPFRILKLEEPDTYSSISDYFKYLGDIKYIGEISIGTPRKVIQVLLSFQDYGLYLFNKGTDINNIPSTYDSTQSTTYKKSSDTHTFYMKKYNVMNFVSDSFIFNSDNNNDLECKNVTFLYSKDDNGKKNSFLVIGLKLMGDQLRDGEINIVNQLKKNLRYIDTYDWSLHFDKANPVNGELLIGSEPHKYNPKIFNENNYFNSVTKIREIIDYWSMEVDKIFFDVNENEQISVDGSLILTFSHSKGFIEGSKYYGNLINKYFFDEFIEQGKCNIETYKTYSKVYSCTNTPEIKKELKSKFPTLKFLKTSYLYTFELTYDDLFKEKKDKIYFLIWFSDFPSFSWEIGLPFLQKYFFNFNYDNKLISFYNNDLNLNQNNEKNKGYSMRQIFIFILVIFVFAGVNFLIGRKYILLRRKKNKLSAEELENEFTKKDFNSSESKYIPPINNKLTTNILYN